jgi:flagellar hook-basal body complex protein FliE
MTLPVSAISKAAEQISLGPQGSVEPTKSAQPTDPAGGFGSMLTNAIGDLEKTQEAAAAQSQALATGQTQDLSSVVTAVQEAQLSMQLASQVRNKAVEAYTEIFHTQI